MIRDSYVQATFDGFARFRRGEVSSGWFFSDGTKEGTYRIESLDGATPLDIADKEPLFLTETGIWTTDGTENGTVPVTGFDAVEGQPSLLPRNAGISFGNPPQAANLEFEYIAFFAEDETQVWRTDGSADGTVHLLTVPQSAKAVKLLDETSVGVLIGFESAEDSQLWFAADGSSTLIQEFEPQTILSGSGSSFELQESDEPLTIYRRLDTGEVHVGNENILAFHVQSNVAENFVSQLWRTDGTTENTFAIEKVTTVWNYVTHEDRVFFSQEHPDYGFELWETDGTQEGTLVYDLAAGPDEHGFPDNFEIYNEQLYFISNNQLWRIGDSKLRGDLNDDLTVDFADFLAVSHHFGQKTDEGDVDGNGFVDFADFLEVSHSFGRNEFETLRTVEPIQADLDHVELIYEAVMLSFS